MFNKLKRIATSTAILAGLGVPAALGVMYAAPQVAHANNTACAREDNVHITSNEYDSAPNYYVFAFATAMGDGATDYGMSVGANPSGIYVNYGLWNLCWHTTGRNGAGNYYGTVDLYNNGSGRNAFWDTSDLTGVVGSTDQMVNGTTASLWNWNFTCDSSSGEGGFRLTSSSAPLDTNPPGYGYDGYNYRQAYTLEGFGLGDLLFNQGSVFCFNN